MKSNYIKMETLKKYIRENKVARSHDAYQRGYYGVNEKPRVEKYKGKFGTGYILHERARNTSNYHVITYYLRNKNV